MSSDRIRVSYGTTNKVDQFEMVKPEVTYETEVREGETVGQAYKRALRVVELLWCKQVILMTSRSENVLKNGLSDEVSRMLDSLQRSGVEI